MTKTVLIKLILAAKKAVEIKKARAEIIKYEKANGVDLDILEAAEQMEIISRA